MIHGHQCTIWGHPGHCRCLLLLLLPLRFLCAETQGLFSCSWPQSLTLCSQHHPAAGGWAESRAGWSSPVSNRNDQACSLGVCALGLTAFWAESSYNSVSSPPIPIKYSYFLPCSSPLEEYFDDNMQAGMGCSTGDSQRWTLERCFFSPACNVFWGNLTGSLLFLRPSLSNSVKIGQQAQT